MQLTEPYAGVTAPLVRHASLQVVLLRAAACCRWLTIAALTLDAGWRVRTPGAGRGIHVCWFDLPVLGAVALWALALLIDPAPALRLGTRTLLAIEAGMATLALVSAIVAVYKGQVRSMRVRPFVLPFPVTLR